MAQVNETKSTADILTVNKNLAVTGTITQSGSQVMTRDLMQNIGTANGGGWASWVLIATITINTSYADRPILFILSVRGLDISFLSLKFNNTSATDPDVGNFSVFSVSGQNPTFWVYSPDTSKGTWQVWGHLGHEGTWGVMTLHQLICTTAGTLAVTPQMTPVADADVPSFSTVSSPAYALQAS